MRERIALFVAIFLIYSLACFTLSRPALGKPRELADTDSYIRISRQPLLAAAFWGGSRPFVFPLLIKIADQDFSIVSILHLGFSVLAWGGLALALSTSLRAPRLVPLAFAWILVLSLVPHVAGWNFTMLTESLSISGFVLSLTLGIWLLRGWCTWKIILLIIAAFFLAFTRDTNAYLLLFLAGLLFGAVLLRWTARRSLILVLAFLLVFLLNDAAVDHGRRFVFPLTNLMGRRILPNPRAVYFLQDACDMPVTGALMRMQDEFANGENRAFYVSPALQGFRAWLMDRGKSCYARWLLADPVHSLGQPLRQFQELITFEGVEGYFSRAYDPILPRVAEPFFYPGRLAPLLWVLLTLVAGTALIRQFWKDDPLWVGFLLLCLPVFPHLFITWHGDAMAPERHSLSVGLQLMLAFWLLVIIVLDRFLRQERRA